MMNDLDAVVEALENNNSFLLAQHSQPDGDAVGSALALMWALETKGKKAVVYNEDPRPHYCRFLPGADRFYAELGDLAQFDALITLDCGEFSRVGEAVDRLKDFPFVINIDHHTSNPMFGRLNLVDERSSSTCEILHRLFRRWGIEMDQWIAECIYTGIYFDTRGFQNANSTAESMKICGEMLELGVDPSKIARHLFVEKKPEQAVLMGIVVPTLKIEAGGKVAGLVATADMFKRAGAGPESLEGFVEIPNSIEGVEAAYLLREMTAKNGDAMIKGSVRTSDLIDATIIAGRFGGGGHKRAAGFSTKGELEVIRRELVALLSAGMAS
jgi:bifunctional oligoribonuclease and PAP phosphatase NrnA